MCKGCTTVLVLKIAPLPRSTNNDDNTLVGAGENVYGQELVPVMEVIEVEVVDVGTDVDVVIESTGAGLKVYAHVDVDNSAVEAAEAAVAVSVERPLEFAAKH